MKKKPALSCVILSCDSHINKGNSALHCMLAVLQQDFDNFEVILVDNSHTKKLAPKLKANAAAWNACREAKVPVRFVSMKRSVSPGKARNAGADAASGDTLVFLEDDTILLGKDTLSRIHRLAQKYEHGYGAQRLWTKPKWFQKYWKSVLDELANGNTDSLAANSSEAPDGVRGANPAILQSRTFIANFGFCRREAFFAAGSFPDLKGYGFDDDFLMSRLYDAGRSLTLLDDLSVVHVTHPVSKYQTKHRNLLPYFSDLIRRGYIWFHVEKIFKERNPKREDILEPLQGIHYDLRLENAYRFYSHATPLDLIGGKKDDHAAWAKIHRLSKLKFAQLIHVLQESKDLDSFVRVSQADFDNLAPVIDAAVRKDIVSIRNDGVIKKKFSFKFTLPYVVQDHGTSFKKPTPTFNQFPCDDASRKRRYELLKARYPFCEYLRFALIGDDDFVSSEFVEDFWAWPIIIEKDPRIVRSVRSFSDRFTVLERDVAELMGAGDAPTVQTFITDPPYTLNGALAFICAGTRMLIPSDDEKEFYVILNPTMMGRNLSHILDILSENSVYLREIVPNFSQYKIPKHYPERKRADAFLKDQRITPRSLEYSSSSDLYVFVTRRPDIEGIRSKVNQNKLYDHYLL